MLSKILHLVKRPFFSLVIIGASVSPAFAGETILGNSGWKAVWAPSFDDYLDITLDGYDGNAVFIQKSAQFTAPPGPGGFPAIPIQFTQIAFPAAEYIVINDESILNSTGASWGDFHFLLIDHADAAFDPALTNASSPNGFDTFPFVNQAFSDSNHAFDVSGGVVPNGGSWFPGATPGDGQLWIDVVPHENTPYTTFTFKEIPTPEPTTAILLAMGMLFSIRRRGRFV